MTPTDQMKMDALEAWNTLDRQYGGGFMRPHGDTIRALLQPTQSSTTSELDALRADLEELRKRMPVRV